MRNNYLCTLAAVFLILLTMPADAKPKAEEFRNKDFDYSSVRTVLVIPVIYGVPIPQSEAFFDETIQQKWKDLTSQEKSGFSFLIKDPKQIIERDNFVKSVEMTEAMSQNSTTEKALSLAAEYTDAVMTATVTICEYGSIHHPQELIWETKYEDRPYWINGKWETIKVPIRYQKIKPEWDEKYSSGAVKLELRSSKDNTLIYGVNVNAITNEEIFTPRPSLTKHISNILENAVKRVPKK